MLVEVKLVVFEDDLTNEGETVGVYAGGGEADEQIAYFDLAAVDEFGLFHGAYGEAGDIVFVFIVHVRHFSGFAADECAVGQHAAVCDTLDDLFDLGGFVFAYGNVIEKE